MPGVSGLICAKKIYDYLGYTVPCLLRERTQVSAGQVSNICDDKQSITEEATGALHRQQNFMGREMNTNLKQQGMQHQTTVPYTQTRIAWQRKNHSV